MTDNLLWSYVGGRVGDGGGGDKVYNTINLSIHKTYLSGKWTVNNAIREFVQNWIDYMSQLEQHTKIRMERKYNDGPNGYNYKFYIQDVCVGKFEVNNETGTYKMRNFYDRFDWNCISYLGGSTKTSSSDQAGGYGEGLKMAVLVVLQNGGQCSLSDGKVSYVAGFGQNNCLEFTPTVVDEKFEAPTFTVTISLPDNTQVFDPNTFVKLRLDRLEFEMNVGEISVSKVSTNGGRIYVAGIQITYEDKLQDYIISLPKSFNIGRDRNLFEGDKLRELFKKALNNMNPTHMPQTVAVNLLDFLNNKSVSGFLVRDVYSITQATKSKWSDIAHSWFTKNFGNAFPAEEGSYENEYIMNELGLKRVEVSEIIYSFLNYNGKVEIEGYREKIFRNATPVNSFPLGNTFSILAQTIADRSGEDKIEVICVNIPSSKIVLTSESKIFVNVREFLGKSKPKIMTIMMDELNLLRKFNDDILKLGALIRYFSSDVSHSLEGVRRILAKIEESYLESPVELPIPISKSKSKSTFKSTPKSTPKSTSESGKKSIKYTDDVIILDDDDDDEGVDQPTKKAKPTNDVKDCINKCNNNQTEVPTRVRSGVRQDGVDEPDGCSNCGSDVNLHLVEKDSNLAIYNTSNSTIAQNDLVGMRKYGLKIQNMMKKVFTCNTVVNVFNDPNSPVVAFNRGGGLFFNAHYSDRSIFLLFNTIAHELAHNMHSPHNEQFRELHAQIMDCHHSAFVREFMNQK